MRRLLFILAALIALAGCSQQPATEPVSTEESDRVWRNQIAAYDRQTAEIDRQQKVADKQLKTTDAHHERFGKQLDKWEEQSLRMDRILDAMERQSKLK